MYLSMKIPDSLSRRGFLAVAAASAAGLQRDDAVGLRGAAAEQEGDAPHILLVPEVFSISFAPGR